MTDRRELTLALVVAVSLVLFRSVVFIAYEHAFFDSDQAIIGLMAKHLSEGRAFPLFYYGQTYMLGVDAWIAAPIFLIAGPTVGALHAATTFVNVAAVVLLIVGLARWGSLRPFAGLVAVAFFALAPPALARSLIEAGANIGPLMYVPLLWVLRSRPLWFGLVLAVGFLNREFTIYAAFVLLGGDVLERTLWRPDRLRHWLIAGVVALATWQAIQALKPHSDMMGPGTRGALVGGDAGSQVGNIGDRVSFAPAAWPHRLHVMVRDDLPVLFGASPRPDAPTTEGHAWLYWPLFAGLAAMFGRSLWLARTRRVAARAAFGWYLTGVGVLAVMAYIVTRPADGMVPRYLLLAIFVPVGIVATYLALEPRRSFSWLAVGLVVLWSIVTATDTAAQLQHFRHGLEPNETRDLARALEVRGIHVAEAGYWRAYKVTFLTQERVKIASTDVVRISEYQQLARDAGAGLVRIDEQPCAGGEHVSLWYLCR